jgi:hypothetical protein
MVNLLDKKNFSSSVERKACPGREFYDGKRRGAIEQQAGCGNIRSEPRHRE